MMWPVPGRILQLIEPRLDWNTYAQELIVLSNEMLAYARHWEDLRDPERAANFHHAAAAYAMAAAQAQSLAPTVPTARQPLPARQA